MWAGARCGGTRMGAGASDSLALLAGLSPDNTWPPAAPTAPAERVLPQAAAQFPRPPCLTPESPITHTPQPTRVARGVCLGLSQALATPSDKLAELS